MTAAITKKRPPRAAKKLAPVLVTMVLDRSGSMGVCRDETIEAFNSYIEGLRSDEGEAFVSLRQFDDKHDLIYHAESVKTAPTLTHASYVPRGFTALNDAIALAISDADTAKVPKGTKHLVVVLTDGLENASQEHTPASIKDLVREREADGWTFVFLQGNLTQQSAQAVAGTYGVAAGNVAVYSTANPGSTSSMMASMRGVTYSASLNAATTSSAFADAGASQDFTNAAGIWTPKQKKAKKK